MTTAEHRHGRGDLVVIAREDGLVFLHLEGRKGRSLHRLPVSKKTSSRAIHYVTNNYLRRTGPRRVLFSALASAPYEHLVAPTFDVLDAWSVSTGRSLLWVPDVEVLAQAARVSRPVPRRGVWRRLFGKRSR